MKTVLITGASSGIGEATAKYFMERKWKVFASARSPEKLGAWSRSGDVIPLRLDVKDADSIASAIANVKGVTEKIDVLVNNAGVGLAGPLEAIPIHEIEEHFQTNVFGTVRMIQAILPLFRQHKEGVIVNISSVAGTFGIPFLSPYCAGKFAIEGLSESLFYELLGLNIRIKLVEPGGIKTQFQQIFAQHDAYQPSLGIVEERMTRYERRPDSPLPEPRSVAEVAFKAATDGGQRLRYPVKTQGASFLHHVMPDSMWRSFFARSFGMGSRTSWQRKQNT